MTKLADVAKYAGVGVGTVSRVINNSGYVKSETRDKVEKAIQDLNYIPNETARVFKKQNPQIVAIIIPTIWHPFYSKFAHYIEKALSEYNYTTMICSSYNSPEKDISYISMLKQNKISAAICISYNDIESYIEKDTNIIFLDRIIGKGIPYVASNNYKGGWDCAEYFHTKGLCKLAHVGIYSNTTNSDILNRKVGFYDYINEHGLEYFEFLMDSSIKDLETFAEKILVNYKDFDAVFCENDHLALVLYNVAIKKGINIPGELSIIGYDGILNNEFPFSPILSTVVQPLEEITSTMVDLIIAKINNKKIPRRTIIDPVLFIGDTSI